MRIQPALQPAAGAGTLLALTLAIGVPGLPRALGAQGQASRLDATARAVELVPFAGVQFGGRVRVADETDEMVTFRSAPAYGVALDVRVRRGGHAELLYSRQRTTLERRAALGAPRGEPLFDMTVEQFQLGGLNDFAWRRALSPFVTATVGLTHYSPSDSRLAGDWNFGGTVGGGVKARLADRVVTRLQLRAHGTFLDSRSRLFCILPGGCAVKLEGQLVVQGELSVGLGVTF